MHDFHSIAVGNGWDNWDLTVHGAVASSTVTLSQGSCSSQNLKVAVDHFCLIVMLYYITFDPSECFLCLSVFAGLHSIKQRMQQQAWIYEFELDTEDETL